MCMYERFEAYVTMLLFDIVLPPRSQQSHTLQVYLPNASEPMHGI